MYHALRLAAKRGMSEIKPLLLAAGNDRKCMDDITSIDYLIYETNLVRSTTNIAYV
jgi:hypothetical protein